jgi:hypothetical protein
MELEGKLAEEIHHYRCSDLGFIIITISINIHLHLVVILNPREA